MTDSREIQDKEELDCPVCMKLMRTHTYSDLTDCMKKIIWYDRCATFKQKTRFKPRRETCLNLVFHYN